MLSRLGAFVDTVGWRRRYQSFANGQAAHSREGLEFFRTRKAQYRYRIRGRGQTIVFLADPPVTIEAYDQLFDALDPHYRVIVIEAAGMGFSAANNQYGFGFRESNDDLAIVLREVAGPQAVLAFSCVAGLAAIDIAVRHPELVKRLLLFQTTDWEGFQIWMQKRDPRNILRRPVIGQLGLKRVAASRAPDWIKFATGNPAMVAPLCRCAAEGFQSDMIFSLASAFQRYLKGSNPLGLPSQPMTIVWGEKDKSHDEDSIERSRNLGFDVDIIRKSALGHFPELEDTQGLLELLRAIEGQ